MRTLPAGHNGMSIRARHGGSADRLGLTPDPGFRVIPGELRRCRQRLRRLAVRVPRIVPGVLAQTRRPARSPDALPTTRVPSGMASNGPPKTRLRCHTCRDSRQRWKLRGFEPLTFCMHAYRFRLTASCWVWLPQFRATVILIHGSGRTRPSNLGLVLVLSDLSVSEGARGPGQARGRGAGRCTGREPRPRPQPVRPASKIATGGEGVGVLGCRNPSPASCVTGDRLKDQLDQATRRSCDLQASSVSLKPRPAKT